MLVFPRCMSECFVVPSCCLALTLGLCQRMARATLAPPLGTRAAQDCKMPSRRLGSGHRDFPFLTILGNGTTQSRHSLSTLYGIQQTGREHPSAPSSEEQVGCSLLGRRTSGVLWLLMRASHAFYRL